MGDTGPIWKIDAGFGVALVAGRAALGAYKGQHKQRMTCRGDKSCCNGLSPVTKCFLFHFTTEANNLLVPLAAAAACKKRSALSTPTHAQQYWPTTSDVCPLLCP